MLETAQEKISSRKIGEPEANVCRFKVPIAKTLKKVEIWTPAAGLTSTFYFNVSIDGVPQLATPDRLQVGAPGLSDSAAGLAIACAAGATLSLDLVERVGSGSIFAPVFFIATFDDGIEISTDGTFAANSDLKIPTEKATQTRISAMIAAAIAASDVEVLKGGIDCSANPNYPAADAGHVYRVTVAGKIGGASGPNVEVNDRLECFVDGSAAGNHASVGGNWFISQVNIDGAVTGPVSATANAVVLFDGTTGKIVKNSAKTISTDGTFAADSDDLVPTQKAAKAYADSVGGGGGGGVDVQVFNTAGTHAWTNPSPATPCPVRVILFGAGGGGGGGRFGSSGSNFGGSGGGGGAYNDKMFLSTHLASSEDAVVGAGGTGGAGSATVGADGADGAQGGNTTFGTGTIKLAAGGGGGGYRGVASNSNSGGAGGACSTSTAGIQGQTGTAANALGGLQTAANTTPAVGSFGASSQGGQNGVQAEYGGASAGGARIGGCSMHGGGAGGGGNSASSGNAATSFAGGQSGTWNIAGGGGGAAGVSGASPTAGANGADGNSIRGGSGGGGGGTTITAAINAGNGGNGGFPGGGGGGGGGKYHGSNATGAAGTGGTGGAGLAIIITYL
jgi:hypothetical protein